MRNLSGEAIQTLGYAFNVSLEANYNETSTLSFSYPAHVDGKRVPGYEKLVGMRIVDMVGVGQFIITNPGITESASKEIKTVKAYSLEYEFTYKKLTLSNSTYNFWNPAQPSNTILGIILEKMPSWSVGSVDEALIGKYRTYEVNNENCYSFMKGTLQESYSCIFDFDTYNRKINVRDVSSKANIQPVYISLDNLAKEIIIDEQTEDIFTCLDVNGADGVTIRDVNPLGTNKIYCLDYFMTTDNFQQTLIDKWNNWKQGFKSHQQEYYNLTVENALMHVQLETERAALTTLEGELKVLEQQQSVAIEAAAQGIETDLSSYNTQISAKRAEISTKSQLIASIENGLSTSQSNLASINQQCSWSAYGITDDDMIFLDRYIKEDSIEDSSFVSPTVDSFTVSGDSYPKANTSITISGSSITGATLSSGKVVYAARGGTASVSINGEVKLSGSIIQAAFDIQDGSGVASLYLETGCATLSGAMSVSTNCTEDSQIGGSYIEGTTASITSSTADAYITRQLTAFSQKAVEWDLFEYGMEVLNRISYPSYSFSVDSGNFLAMDEFDAFRRELKLGDQLYLNLGSDFGVLFPVLIGTEIDFESKSLKLNFSDSFSLSDSAFKLADLLDQSISMGKSVDLSKYTSQEFHNAGGTSGVQQLMDTMRDAALNGIFSSGNQAFSIDDSGIALRKWTDSTHTAYEDEQIRMTSNQIVFTRDNWNTAAMAIGKFTDTNLGDIYGVCAPNLVGTMIAGQNLIIESEKKDGGVSVFRVDGDGAKLYNSIFDLVNEYVVDDVASIGQISLNPSIGIVAGSLSSENAFYAYDADGNIEGIKATDGTTISSVSDIGDRTPLANFWCDNQGNVYLKGNIYATDGVFTGTVYATDGEFKGVVQASDFLDSTGKSMLTDDGKFDSNYLDLGNIILDGETGNITLNGSISFGTDAAASIKTAADDGALSAATSAQSTANTANSNASSALSTANSAYNNANSALNNLVLLANGQYQGGTFIDGKNLYSPNLYGDTITLMDGKGYAVGAMSLQKSSTYAFDLTSNLSLRLQASNGNAYIGASSGAFLTLGTYGSTPICQLGQGAFVTSSYSYGTSLPSTAIPGHVFFLVS